MQPPPNHRAEPHWHPTGRLRRGEIPAWVRCWLTDPASLTARLKRACGGRFSVRVVSQGRGRPHLGEALALGIPPGESALVRQVQLLCDGRPWVFARTVIPNSTLSGPRRRLARLGSRPLGEVLFRDPSMERGEVEVARVTPRHGLHPLATAGLDAPPGELWGRRSLFRLGGRPLLVAEFFLPGIGRCR